jgi:hypothetical protein
MMLNAYLLYNENTNNKITCLQFIEEIKNKLLNEKMGHLSLQGQLKMHQLVEFGYKNCQDIKKKLVMCAAGMMVDLSEDTEV